MEIKKESNDYIIMEIKKESNDYIIKFNNHEVLVFFEWLVKFVENNQIIDEAEQKYYMT